MVSYRVVSYRPKQPEMLELPGVAFASYNIASYNTTPRGIYIYILSPHSFSVYLSGALAQLGERKTEVIVDPNDILR